MDIITKEKKIGRLEDGIETLLSLSEEEFDTVLKRLEIKPKKDIEKINFFYTTDQCEMPSNPIQTGLEDDNKKRFYYVYGEKRPTMSKLFKLLSSKLEELPVESVGYLRCLEILNKRGLEALKSKYSNKEQYSEEIVNKLFEMLNDEELYKQFLDYDNNMQTFSIGGNDIEIKKYLKLIGDMFGNINKEGNFPKEYEIRDMFYIPQLNNMLEKVKGIYQKYNLDRYVDSRYEFRNFNINEDYIGNEDEPDWDINLKLYKKIYEDMPDNLSLEEQALYIYTKLCLNLEYNEEYMYKEQGISSKFDSKFSKDKLEAVEPGDKVTCYEFNRIFAKFINQIEGDIEAVVISEGWNEGHFSAGFYTDKVSARLEPVNIHPFTRKAPVNDIMRAKHGINLNGIKIISDRDGLIQDALDKIQRIIYGKEGLPLKSYLKQLKYLPEMQVKDDVKLKIQSLIEVIKAKGIKGNEFVQTFDGMCKMKFFGENVEKAYIGKRIDIGEEKHIQRMILMRNKTNSQELAKEDTQEELYLIDTSTLDFTEPTLQEIIAGLNSGDLVYENEERKLPGIDKEV